MLCCCSFLFASRTGFSNWVLLFMWLEKKLVLIKNWIPLGKMIIFTVGCCMWLSCVWLESKTPSGPQPVPYIPHNFVGDENIQPVPCVITALSNILSLQYSEFCYRQMVLIYGTTYKQQHCWNMLQQQFLRSSAWPLFCVWFKGYQAVLCIIIN